MFRRGFSRLQSNLVSTRIGNSAPLESPTTGTVATAVGNVVPTRRIKIKVDSDAVKNFKASASQAPELLESYVKPTPFVSQRNFQLFTVSFVVGSVTICGLYFLVSKSLADDYEREQLYADGIRVSNDRHEALLKEFVAPSSYRYLQDKMERRQAETLEEEMVKVSMLHSEILYRAKVWWNRQLTIIDSVLTRMWDRMRHQSEFDAIRGALAVRGYDLVALKEVETSA